MHKIQIYDFDGVLLNSFDDQFRWFSYICRALEKNFSYRSIEEFREAYREPVYPDMYLDLGFVWEQEKDIIWKEYNSYKKNNHVRLFDGIEETIKEIYSRGIRLAIASSNTSEVIHKYLNNNNIISCFDLIVGKEDLPEKNGEPLLKPHPACILKAIEELGCETDDAIYIGDQPSDIIAARGIARFGHEPMKVAAVSYGFSPKPKLAELKPDYMIDSPQELLNLLL